MAREEPSSAYLNTTSIANPEVAVRTILASFSMGTLFTALTRLIDMPIRLLHPNGPDSCCEFCHEK